MRKRIGLHAIAIIILALCLSLTGAVCENEGKNNINSALLLTFLQPQPIYIGGIFATYNGSPMNRIGRLNKSGTRDASFSPVSGPNGSVWCIINQADGKIIIAGEFTSYNGTACGRIARINTDGSLDTTFNSGGSGADSSEIIDPCVG